MKKADYNPDILNCLANLSSDEVFTSPELANKLIDLLPKDLFCNPNTTFLDPGSKSGVFLREIAKRLLDGLKDKIPNLQERINHIMGKQLFGIATTQLTAHLSRRTLYCSKKADSKYSITDVFNKRDSKYSFKGNIKYGSHEHTWKNGSCTFCGASQEEYSRLSSQEQHAYIFIHTIEPKEIFNMKFDVIIGNPPYQLSDGGAQASAKPIYQHFITNAKKLQPKYLCMIIPARWYAGGKGLDSFRNEMINDTHLSKLYDFSNSADCFPTLGDRSVKGGICYFLWDKNHDGPCDIYTMVGNKCVNESRRFLKEEGVEIFIRDAEGISLLNKVRNFKEDSFSSIVSTRKPFGLATNFTDFSSTRKNNDQYEIYAYKAIGYIDTNKIEKNVDWVFKHKLLMPEAIGNADVARDRLKPIYAEPGTCCTETYLVFGPFNSKKQCDNCTSYINTKFFHFLLSLKKITQHTTQKCYEFIPLQDFNEEWSDEKLYKKYGLTDKEIEYIEKTVWPEEED